MTLTGFKWFFCSFRKLHRQWITFLFWLVIIHAVTFNENRVFLVIISKRIYWSFVIQYWYNVIFLKLKKNGSMQPPRKKNWTKAVKVFALPCEIDAAIPMGLSVSVHANWLKRRSFFCVNFSKTAHSRLNYIFWI